MSKKIFNPNEWQAINTEQPATPTYQNTVSNSPNSDIEEITQRIESTQTDIAPNYADWRDVGFSLADGLGENGRSYYHRLSRFYPQYNQAETDKQYNACLTSHGHGVSLKTFYHLAKNAGISIAIAPTQIAKYPNIQNGNLDIWQNQNPEQEEAEEKKLPTFPAEIFSQLPDFLKQITKLAISLEDADLLLLGSLTVVSACLPKIVGIYGGVTVYPNLFLFVTAQASAGKGRLSLCRRLIEPIHQQLREVNQLEYEDYKRKQAEYVANKKNPDSQQPEEPPLRVLFIPANSSATAVFQILGENKGEGILFETEGDTLAQTFRSEHGNYSDGFRKAFHHEKISYLRRKDREYVTLETPKLSAVLSGTPRQIQSLIPDAENGLFSRFMFYYMNLRLEWNNVFAAPNGGESLDTIFNRYGHIFFDFYQVLKQCGEITFSLTKAQQEQFNAYFSDTQAEYYDTCGQDYIGTVRRLGLTAYRIALVLSVIRTMETSDFCPTLVCTDTDFNNTMQIIQVLIQHAARVFRMLPQIEDSNNAIQNEPRNLLLNALPPIFDRTLFLSTAQKLGIPPSTADKQIKRYIDRGLLLKITHNQYQKRTS